MSIRLLIQGGGPSPMRVLASGANVSTATFNDLLFDANYRAMRQIQLTQFSCTLAPSNGFADTFIPLVKTFVSPPLAVGMIHWVNISGSLNGYQTPRIDDPTILGDPPPSGGGIGTTTTQAFCEHGFSNVNFSAVSASILVFDFPMS